MSKQTPKQPFFTPDQRQAINRLDLRELIDLKPDPKGERYKYCCPVCGSGTTGAADSNGALHDGHSRGKGWRCFSCGQAKGSPGHDTIGILGYVWQQTPKGVKDRLLKAGLIPADNAPETHQKPQEAPLEGRPIQTLEQIEATQKMLARAEARLLAQADDLAKEAWQYLTEDRGLLSWTIEDTGIGCLEYKGKKAISIPLNAARTRYIVRYLEGSTKYETQPGLEPDLWNAQALYESQAVFITEGALDGMSIAQTLDSRGSDIGATALCSTGNADIFIKRLNQMKADGLKTPRLILALDKDKSGQDTTETLAKELADNGISYSVAAYPDRPDLADEKGKVDPNGFMTKDQAGFQTWLEEGAAAQVCDPIPTMAEYMEHTFQKDYEAFVACSQIRLYGDKTANKDGWKSLDEKLGGMFPGLTIFGALPGTGKTTFCWQLASQIAEQGRAVLFFSFEQNSFVLGNKSMARLEYERRSDQGYKNEDIMNPERLAGKDGYDALMRRRSALWTAFKESTAGKLRVVEAHQVKTLSDIITMIKSRHANGQADCVFIDFLQKITTGGRADKKEQIDEIVKTLQQTASELMIPIWAISSLNRKSYSSDITIEAFKESGDIEYCADCILGLQNDMTEAKKRVAEMKKEGEEYARKLAYADEREKARKAPTWQMELICLKKKLGRGSFRQRLSYVPSSDYFCPEADEPEGN